MRNNAFFAFGGILAAILLRRLGVTSVSLHKMVSALDQSRQ